MVSRRTHPHEPTGRATNDSATILLFGSCRAGLGLLGFGMVHVMPIEKRENTMLSYAGVRLLLVALLLICGSGFAIAANMSQERLRAVARMLSEAPWAFGQPISDRKAWTRMAARPGAEQVVERAVLLAAQPLPEQPDDLYLDYSRTGNRNRWQRVAGRRRSRIGPLVLAECLEDEGRFLPAIRRTIEAICAEPTWVMPAHDGSLRNFRGETVDIDLGSSALAWELAAANALLGNRLPTATRDLIERKVRQRVIEPYLAMVRGEREANWWMRTTNNWNAVCLAGVTGAALAQVRSREERAVFVVAAEHYSQNFLDGFTPDGYCSEGVGYWNYGFGHYVLLAEAVYQATGGGVDLMQREGVREPALFGSRIEIINGLYPAFADCAVGTRPDRRILWYVGRKLGMDLGGDRLEKLSAWGSLRESLMYEFPNSASAGGADGKAPGPQPRTWFQHAGVFIGRPQPDSACRMGVALKGGHNAEHHNHNDVGSYVVALGEQTVLVDPGAEVYTARTFSSRRYESDLLNSFGHPVPVVDGNLQKTGKEARAKARVRFGAERYEVTLDLRPAYPVEGLQALERTFVYSRRNQGSLTVTDVVRFDRPRKFGTALVTFGRWKRLDDTSLLIYDTEEAVRVDINGSGIPFTIAPQIIQEDIRADHPPLRLGIELTRPVAETTIRLDITPYSRETPILRNGGFEEGEWAWNLGNKMATISTDRAAEGEHSLRILDSAPSEGSNVLSARAPIPQEGSYTLTGRFFGVSGDGLGMYVRYLDDDGKLLNERTNEQGWISPILTLGGDERRWRAFSQAFEVPPGAESLQLWIHSFSSARVEAFLDDLAIEPTGDN